MSETPQEIAERLPTPTAAEVAGAAALSQSPETLAKLLAWLREECERCEERADRAYAALAQLQQEWDALLEALEHVVAVLPSPIWNEHQVLVWSQLDIEKMRAALATSQRGA